jgi:hypothetical protein
MNGRGTPVTGKSASTTPRFKRALTVSAVPTPIAKKKPLSSWEREAI